MTIHFYLDDENETEIMSFHDMASNPFVVDDIISLDVDEIYPSDYNRFKIDSHAGLQQKSEDLRLKFRNKKIIINRLKKYARFSLLRETHLTIECHCDFYETNN